MAEFLSLNFSSNFKAEINSFLAKKENAISSKLREKLYESMEYVRTKMSDYAQSRSGELKEIINSLPISAISSSRSSFSFTKSGNLEVAIRLDRVKDKRILWADRGTGIYGPFRRVIRPTNGEFIYFEIDGQFIKTRTTLGQPGTHFIRSAVNSSRLIIKSKILSAIRES